MKHEMLNLAKLWKKPVSLFNIGVADLMYENDF